MQGLIAGRYVIPIVISYGLRDLQGLLEVWIRGLVVDFN